MKRWLLILLAVCCGCAAPGQILPSDGRDGVQPTELTLVVQEGLSAQGQLGLETFCDKVEELSGGRMQITVQEQEDVFSVQEWDLLFASNEEIARANGDFASYSSPFYFNDYTHMSLTLNSSRFLEIIGDRNRSLLGADPLAALYDGNSVLVSRVEGAMESVDQWAEARVVIGENEILEYLLKKMGAEVVIRDDEGRIDGLRRGHYPLIEWDTMRLDELEDVTAEQSLTVCESFHRARINWLMLDCRAQERLTKENLAILQEAAAFAVYAADAATTEREQRGFALLDDAGVGLVGLNYREYFENADSILSESARYMSAWDWTRHREIRDLARNSSV